MGVTDLRLTCANGNHHLIPAPQFTHYVDGRANYLLLRWRVAATSPRAGSAFMDAAMASDITRTDPKRFGLESFADILPSRDPIVGEDPGSFDCFREALHRSLSPMTPYEYVVAENLIAIEWELIQRRRMREASLREHVRSAIRNAIIAQHRFAYETEVERHLSIGAQH